MCKACWEWTVLPPGLVLTAPHEAWSPISRLSRHVAVVILALVCVGYTPYDILRLNYSIWPQPPLSTVVQVMICRLYNIFFKKLDSKISSVTNWPFCADLNQRIFGDPHPCNIIRHRDIIMARVLLQSKDRWIDRSFVITMTPHYVINRINSVRPIDVHYSSVVWAISRFKSLANRLFA